jgi:hypothetical protein
MTIPFSLYMRIHGGHRAGSGKTLNQPGPEKIKDGEETADKQIEVRTVTEKGKLLERAGRKITGLKPFGQGSGIAEVDRPFGELGVPNRKAGSVAHGTREARERPTGGQG